MILTGILTSVNSSSYLFIKWLPSIVKDCLMVSHKINDKLKLLHILLEAIKLKQQVVQNLIQY